MNSEKFSLILKEGALISTKMSESNVWNKNIIYKNEDNIVYMSLLDSYLNDVVMVGSDIFVKHTNEYYEYVFKSTVVEIVLGNVSYVAVKINDVNEVLNTRAFKRYDIFFPANIRPENSKTAYFSIINNISNGGLSFISNHDFSNGEVCELSIMLSKIKGIVHAKGEIIRKYAGSDIINYGIKFDDIDFESSTILAKYLLETELPKNK